MEPSWWTWKSDEWCSCWEIVRWRRVKRGCASMPKLIWSHAIAAKSSVKPPRTALLRPNRWSIVFTRQKNFAEALEKFFRKQERVLKKATRGSTGKTHPAARTAVPQKIAQERRARHRQQVSVHKRISQVYREGYDKEQSASLVC